ncbi:hypothetical protein [Streptomyces sp. NPDC001508]|uniref:hypothetical protein n=1 Tax=Streptomyces sp. NPDC001508 TaxID=3154656 RepID=UPI00331F17BA
MAERKVSAVIIGLVFTSASVVRAGASWVQGRVLEAWPRYRLVRLGALVQTGAVAVAVAGTLPGVPPLTAAAAMPLAAIGMGMLEPSLIVLSLAHSRPGRRGHAGAAMQTNQNLGQIGVLGLSTLVLNICWAAGSSGLVGYGVASAVLLVPSALIVLLAGRTRD